MNAGMILVGAILTVAGVLLLRAAWMARRAGELTRRRKLVSGAWVLLAAALAPWAAGAGADKGTAFAFIVMMLAGAAIVLREGFLHRPARNGSGRLEREGRDNRNGNGGWRLFLRRAWVFVLAGPLSFALSLLLAFILYAAWDMSGEHAAANRLAATLIAVPLAWALLATWMTCDLRLRTRSLHALGLVVAGLGSAWLLGGFA